MAHLKLSPVRYAANLFHKNEKFPLLLLKNDLVQYFCYFMP